MPKYVYENTSDHPDIPDCVEPSPGGSQWANIDCMSSVADILICEGATWAEVKFVRIDDDGTEEVLRRVRVD